jgi:hypothetical protein
MNPFAVIITFDIEKYSLPYIIGRIFSVKFFLLCFNVLKNDSAQVLSQQLPLRLMLRRTDGHRLLITSPNEYAQYWTPLSE